MGVKPLTPQEALAWLDQRGGCVDYTLAPLRLVVRLGPLVVSRDLADTCPVLAGAALVEAVAELEKRGAS